MRGEEVVAIGPSADHEEWLTDRGVRLVVGDHRLIPVLRTAGVADAAVLVLTDRRRPRQPQRRPGGVRAQPDIRLVIRMFDQELGAHIPDLFPDAVALSSSALAAPGFVSAAIDGETGSRFRLAGRLLASRHSADPPQAPISVPIARLNPDRTVEMLPDVDATGPDLIVIDVAEEDPAALATRP